MGKFKLVTVVLSLLMFPFKIFSLGEEIVFNNTESEVPYRIPAIAKNKNGDIVAVADYRYSGKDIGMEPDGKLDLRYRIKDKQTGEWSPVKTLIGARGEGESNIAFGDPCLVADKGSDRVLLTSCCGNVSFPKGTRDNHQGWARIYSEDGGFTWGDYTDISYQVYNQLDSVGENALEAFFIGSGKIEQSDIMKKDNYYRLYCAALAKLANKKKVNYVFYSDDFGETWHLLGDKEKSPIPEGGDEPKIAELPDGSVVISSRTPGGRLFNIFRFTDMEKGEGHWEEMSFSGKNNGGVVASQNACNGEILCIPVTRVHDEETMYLLLQSVPFGPSDRSHVGINYKVLTTPENFREPEKISKDWGGTYLVSDKTGAYSTMVVDSDGDIAFFMEENILNQGYDMVYKKLPIEIITEGKYIFKNITSEEREKYLNKSRFS